MWTLINIAKGLALLGGVISVLNFYLSWLRYPLYRLRGGKRESYRFVSGIPLFGSLLLWIAAPYLHSEPVWMWSALVVSLFDMCGLHVIAVVMLIAALHKPPNPRE
jgi:hypothetical protein